MQIYLLIGFYILVLFFCFIYFTCGRLTNFNTTNYSDISSLANYLEVHDSSSAPVERLFSTGTIIVNANDIFQKLLLLKLNQGFC